MKLNLIAALAAAALSLGSQVPGWAAPDPAGTLNLAPCISWRNPNRQPRFAILCIHGLGLYSKSYASFGRNLARFGAIVYAIDVRGFGSWIKAAGQQDMDFAGCLEDIQAALKEIHLTHPGLPVYLLGESMGGAIALRAATMYPDLIDGVISAVPAAERFNQKRTDLKVALQILSGPRKQRESIGKQVVEQAATDRQDGVVNKKLASAWADDPLDRLNLSPKDLVQFQKFMNDNHDAVKNLKDPILFMQGLDDDLVRPDGTWDLMKEVPVQDRTMVALPARHLMLEEAQHASDPKVAAAAWHHVLGWILSRLPERNPGDASSVAAALAEDTGDGSGSSGTPASLAGLGNPASTGSLRKISSATAAAVTQGAPTVVTFYAKWCDQCDKISAFVDRAQPVKGLRVRFVKYDVDDPNNAGLIKEFGVGAIPQLMFVRADGTINSSIMGAAGAPVILKNVADLLGR